MVGTDYSGQDLTGRDFRGENLRDANFSGATLTQARLSGCDLTGANFTGANAYQCFFDECVLRNALFCDANLEFAVLGGADVSTRPSEKRPVPSPRSTSTPLRPSEIAFSASSVSIPSRS